MPFLPPWQLLATIRRPPQRGIPYNEFVYKLFGQIDNARTMQVLEMKEGDKMFTFLQLAATLTKANLGDVALPIQEMRAAVSAPERPGSYIYQPKWYR